MCEQESSCRQNGICKALTKILNISQEDGQKEMKIHGNVLNNNWQGDQTQSVLTIYVRIPASGYRRGSSGNHFSTKYASFSWRKQGSFKSLASDITDVDIWKVRTCHILHTHICTSFSSTTQSNTTTTFLYQKKHLTSPLLVIQSSIRMDFQKL